MGIRPAIYTSGSYASILQAASPSLRDLIAKPASNLPSVVSPAASSGWSPGGSPGPPTVSTSTPSPTPAP